MRNKPFYNNLQIVTQQVIFKLPLKPLEKKNVTADHNTEIMPLLPLTGVHRVCRGLRGVASKIPG
jgi:hypothetical protein